MDVGFISWIHNNRGEFTAGLFALMCLRDFAGCGTRSNAAARIVIFPQGMPKDDSNGWNCLPQAFQPLGLDSIWRDGF